MLINEVDIMALVPIRGPRPNIRKSFKYLIDKLEDEEARDKEDFPPGVALAIVDYWIGALCLTRSYIQNHAAGGRDFDLTK